MVAGKAVQTYGMELENHQQLVLCAAEIMIEIYVAESAVLKAEKVAGLSSEKEAESQIAMAKLNLCYAIEKINTVGKEGIVYFSEGDEQRMMLMGLKRFTKYTNYPNVVSLRNKIAEKLNSENKYCF